MLQIQFSQYARKFIKKNQTSNSGLIRKLGLAIKELTTNPLPQGCKKLTGYPFYRIRISDYRIVYRFDDKILYVILIEKRDKVYNSLNKIK